MLEHCYLYVNWKALSSSVLSCQLPERVLRRGPVCHRVPVIRGATMHTLFSSNHLSSSVDATVPFHLGEVDCCITAAPPRKFSRWYLCRVRSVSPL